MTASASEKALRALEETGRLDLAHVGVAARELGHIRVRLGDTEGAEQAFRRAHEYGISPEPGMSLVRSVLMGLILPTCVLAGTSGSSPVHP